ncbi:hypothetical protein [Bradyrhizobium liaoningense]|uniref:hypothetical protein n=1 Tax=Bradyrhizobium liaoningense TaxID=43992 RepID=UPI001BA647F8|nr:hypothetical protein [Bradyrhizobium liaoningense]MBR0713667.1 hypothetical protein [Bradyrhizobium liaoningense]
MRSMALLSRIQPSAVAPSANFNQHCHRDGSVDDSSFTLGLEATVKKIPYKFNVGSTSNRAKMEEFCKTGLAQNFFEATSNQFYNTVVVPALTNFNECLRLENEGLRITHQEQAPRSVLIFGEITKSTLNATLDVVEYDKDRVSCATPNFSDQSEAIGPGDPTREIKRNFTITCVRTPIEEDGKKTYPPTKIGISTSVGPYTVSLIEDQLNGFFLASEAKAKFDDAIRQLGQARINADLLLERIKKANVTMQRFYNGDPGGDSAVTGPRRNCEDPNAYAKAVCGNKRVFLSRIAASGGGRCGYDHWNLACLDLDQSPPSARAASIPPGPSEAVAAAVAAQAIAAETAASRPAQ